MDDERTSDAARGSQPARLGAAPARADAHHAARRRARRTAGVLHRRVRSSSGCRSTRSTRRPPRTGRRSPTQRSRGATCSRRTGATSATPATRGRRTCARLSTSSIPKVSQPGDFYGSDQSPNLLGTERTGPDLSQESGWHPDDWQRAHFYDPRFVDPLSLMPPMKSLFSDTQVEQLITYVETAQRQVGPAALRRSAVLEARRHDEPGLPAAVHRLPGRAQADPRGQRQDPQPAEGPARRGAEPRADRPQLLALRQSAAGDRAEPAAGQGSLPAALRRLPRHRRRRQGPGASFMSPSPADFTERRRRMLRRRHRAGRLLLPHPPRLARDGDGELRRPAVGRRHLARRAVREDDPEPHARARTSFPNRRTTSSGSPRRSCSPGSRAGRSSRGTRRSRRRQVTDPFMQEAMRVLPGLAPGDKFFLNDGKTPLSLDGRGGGHQGDLPGSARPCVGRGAGARRQASTVRAEGHSSDRPGPAMSRLLRSVAVVGALAPRRTGGCVRSRGAGERAVALGDGRLDARSRSSCSPASRWSRSSGRGRRATSTISSARRAIPLLIRRGGLLHAGVGVRRGGVGRMSMPTGDTPEKVTRLLSLPERPSARRRIRSRPGMSTGSSLAWLWGFVVVLVVVLLLWVKQYRTTQAAHGHLSGGQLRRLDDRSRQTGDAVLPPLHRDHRRRSRSRSSSDTSSAGRSSDGRRRGAPFVSYSSMTEALIPASRVADGLLVATGAEGPRPGVPGLSELRRVRASGGTTATCSSIATPPGTRAGQLEVFLERGYTFERLLARHRLGAQRGPEPRDGEGLLMAQNQDDQPRPARPLVGYRDVGEDVRHGPACADARLDRPRDPDRDLPRLDADDLLPRTGPSLAHVYPAPLVAGVLHVCGVLRGRGRCRSPPILPGAKPPVRTEPYADDELTRARQRGCRSTSSPAARSCLLGGVHMVLKNLPWTAEWLARAGYAGHLVRDLSNTHVMIVGGGTLISTGLCWYVLPRIVATSARRVPDSPRAPSGSRRSGSSSSTSR